MVQPSYLDASASRVVSVAEAGPTAAGVFAFTALPEAARLSVGQAAGIPRPMASARRRV
jgi:hypothetical protein